MSVILEEKKEDDLLYVYSILRRLGGGEVNTFEQRLKSQKIQYFAQLFGLSLKYEYNLYLKGPYSPSLAHDLYFIKEKGIEPIKFDFAVTRLAEKFTALSEYLEDMNGRQMELVSTYHWLRKVATLNKVEAEQRLILLKEANEKDVIYANLKFQEYERIKKSFE